MDRAQITIRQETPADYTAIYALTQAAFADAEHADGDEQELVERLRKSAAYIPELSLVAERDGQLVGHVMFTEITAGGRPALILGPVSVLPAYQKKGIGGALIAEGHRIAAVLGYDLCALVGHAEYYPRFGYERIDRHEITFPLEAPPECMMVKFLTEQGKTVKGAAVFPPEFSVPTIREMRPAEYPQLEDFLYHAIFQPPGTAQLPREVIFQPEIYVYIDGFAPAARAGDVAAVAKADGQVIGMAWTRIIPGYGHIDADTPELAISVLPAHRGKGIGTALLTQLFDLLRERGYRQTSLSVQTQNPAARLYQRVGYEILEDRGEDWLMVKRL